MTNTIFGTLGNNDASFRALCTALAADPSYAAAPFQRVVDIYQAVQRNHTFAALHEGALAGAIIWTECSDEAATSAVGRGHFPGYEEFRESGPALAVTGFVAQSQAVALRMLKLFLKQYSGRTVLYQRQRLAGPARFGWVDRSGRRMGSDV